MRPRRMAWLAATATALLTAASGALADKLFETQFTVGGVPIASDGTNKISNVPDMYNSSSLDALLGSGFNPVTDDFLASLNLRGLNGTLSWTASTGELALVIPEVLDIRITGTNYEDVLDRLEDWLKGDFETDLAPSDALTALLQGLVEHSPVDPFAGNPNSLQSRMLSSDYRLGTEGPFTSGDGPLDPSTNLVGLGLEYGHFSAGGYRGELLELPIDYRINFRDPKWSLLFNLPLTATFTEDQWSILASGALGVQFRPTEWWSLTPLFRMGAAGSIDVGALGVLYGFTLTNHMRLFEWRGIRLAMGNMAGFTKSMDDIEVGDYQFSYDITNPMTRNGGYVEGEFDLLGVPAGWKVFGSNMLLFGDDLFAESQNEVGVQLSTLGRVGGKPYEAIGLSAAYVFANDYDAVSLRLRFRF
ncbi:MAG TPA: hypothetical protein VIY27_14320 [Myxococcota bacterium]